MREYRQLTEEDRIEIYAMKQAGKEQNMIAAELGVHPSTISRELSRNTGLRGYRPKQAQQKALQRRFNACKAVKMTPETIGYIECKLGQEHSPEQIAERMRAFEAIGIETFLLQFHPVVEELERFGEKLMPLLR